MKKKIYLNYHNLGYPPQIGINKVNPNIFNNHIRLLDNIILKSEGMLDISITFDDGYENVFRFAQKILETSQIIDKKVFIITDYIGKSNNWDFSFHINKYKHLSESQICNLSSSDWEIGSHGTSHRSLLSMSFSEAKDEIVESKKKLEDITGKEVFSIAPPFSLINQKIYDCCGESGYRDIYLQKTTDIHESKEIKIKYRNNVYSIDNNRNIIAKINKERGERLKESFISSFNNLTVFFSKYFY